HPPPTASTNLSHIPCKFFKAGACTAGKNCVFSHNKDPGADSYVCKYYLKGNCKFGNKCALSHALPNDRKGMNGRPMMGRLTASQSSGTRSVSNGQMDMRSPTTRGLSAGVDFSQNPVSPNRGSFGGDNSSPFTRIPINAKSPTTDHSPGRPFSHLTASIKQPQDYYGTSPSSFYDEPRRPKLIPVAPSSSSHLSPLPIRQKPVPEMYKASPTGSDLSSSPFHNPSQPKSLFLPPMSYGSDNGGVLSPSHLQTLRSIPEGGDYFGDVEDYEGEEGGLDLEHEQGFLPSSLNELLTPTELEMRRLREERASFRESRRNYSDFERDDQYLSVYSTSADPQNGPMLIGRSLPVGVGVGIGFSRSYGSQRNGDLGGDDSGLSLFFKSSPRQGTFDYPDDPTNVSAVPATAPSASDAFASHHHHGTTAINIPGGSHGFSHGVSHSVPTGHSAMAFAAAKRFNAPDPFSPFAADDEVQFFMEDESLEQSSPQLQQQGGFGAPSAQQQQAQGGGGKAPMSYSAIAKSGLKDSGVASGVSVDTGRRNEPRLLSWCRFPSTIVTSAPSARTANMVLIAACRSWSPVEAGGTTVVPSRLTLPLVSQTRSAPVSHPRGAPRFVRGLRVVFVCRVGEYDFKHINECMDQQVKVGEDHEGKEVECGICIEKVTGKKDPRFGLLNCEHAFCLQCIRQWRSTNTLDNQVIRSCPMCRTETYFITPSAVWITDRAEKHRVIDEYKRKLSAIPCKHFNQGEGTCPFGTSCFYAHIYKDGTREEINIRTVAGASEVRVLGTVRLSDFLEAQEARRADAMEQ
ncbi:hypothetical protein BC937DRAFT_93265, partial [Endogone sp. FLAS-F59071]